MAAAFDENSVHEIGWVESESGSPHGSLDERTSVGPREGSDRRSSPKLCQGLVRDTAKTIHAVKASKDDFEPPIRLLHQIAKAEYVREVAVGRFCLEEEICFVEKQAELAAAVFREPFPHSPSNALLGGDALRYR